MLPDTVLSLLAILLVTVVLAAVIAGFGTLLWFALELATAPGVVVHEFAHAITCRAVGVRVHEVVYFRLGDPAGYVRHEQPDRYRDAFLIGVAPFLVNTVVALVACLAFAELATGTGVVSPTGGGFPAVDPVGVSREMLIGMAALGWLGLAVGMQAFPSTGDANTLWAHARAKWRRSPLVLLGVPVILVIYVANVLSWLWADVLYAVALLLVAFAVAGTPLL
ncbi:DUF3267 domain-containing protein [Natrialba taiwanensis]|uniref:Peptidase M50 n=1 Tax=Natrialba taiwanensis DSM 12281 TaxID=1230458 RepID=L9ZLI8_9EURY|nr:DUF3267 domain-containing protein [Natrialba taiwanensis]ELY87219.1 hypothetical protein C484_17701 [Natrialba taiwanensis DSM 12281]